MYIGLVSSQTAIHRHIFLPVVVGLIFINMVVAWYETIKISCRCGSIICFHQVKLITICHNCPFLKSLTIRAESKFAAFLSPDNLMSLPSSAHNGHKQPDNFDKILQARNVIQNITTYPHLNIL